MCGAVAMKRTPTAEMGLGGRLWQFGVLATCKERPMLHYFALDLPRRVGLGNQGDAQLVHLQEADGVLGQVPPQATDLRRRQ